MNPTPPVLDRPMTRAENRFFNVTYEWLHWHTPANCIGEVCVVHNPSNHHMREWPLHMRESRLIERACKHHVGHPDPDSAAGMERVSPHGRWNEHGCDGCCIKTTNTTHDNW